MLRVYLDASELRVNLGIHTFMMTDLTCSYLQLIRELQQFSIALLLHPNVAKKEAE